MIGRNDEIQILEKAYLSDKPELVALIGRRRVGKTYLVRNYFQNRLDFEMVGIKDGNKEQQLRNFSYSIRDARKDQELSPTPQDWLEAFYQLKTYLESLPDDRKKVIFIDELPWIATIRSDFLAGFGYFWNSFASKQNIMVIICGSATAWMIKKIINNKGELHNRVTQKIVLKPFTLGETQTYFENKHIHFDYYQLILLYMTMGGIPHYLDQVESGLSAVQNIDKICFSTQGLLRTEFDNLYSSLFSRPQRYEHIVKILANSWKGMNRSQLLQSAKLKDGGSFSLILKELEQSGFISSYVGINKKKKDNLYRLTDNYSLFYLKYIKDIPLNEEGNWQSLSQTQSFKSWSGYAFENICLQHIQKIKEALGIAGVYSKQLSFSVKAKEKKPGAQIDLLIDRQDSVINLCEIKFYNDEFVLTREMAENIRKKRSVLKQYTQTKKQVSVVLITTYGIQQNKHSLGLVDKLINMEALF